MPSFFYIRCIQQQTYHKHLIYIYNFFSQASPFTSSSIVQWNISESFIRTSLPGKVFPVSHLATQERLTPSIEANSFCVKP